MQANALFAEGNQLFAQQAHAPALEKYKAAIALWDHPLIRFNMAVTEIRLDRILEAADDLDERCATATTPFTPELYQQALDYQAPDREAGRHDRRDLRAGRRPRAARRQAVVRVPGHARRSACSPAST